MEEYRSRKMEYSNSRDDGAKNKMLDALEDFMSGVHGMMKSRCSKTQIAGKKGRLYRTGRER